MNRLFLFLFLFVLLISFVGYGCIHCMDGKGHIISESRSVKPFKNLKLNIAADVEVGIASRPAMQIHAQKNIGAMITTKVNGDWLVIDAKDCIGQAEPVMIKVYTSALEKIEINGSGSVQTKQPVVVNKIKFEVNGSGNIYGDVYANEVDVLIRGSGGVVINGTASRQHIKIEGSGICQSIGLKVDDTEVNINGSGKAEVSSLNTLKVRVKGSGDVIYSGNPDINYDVSGSGSVSRMR